MELVPTRDGLGMQLVPSEFNVEYIDMTSINKAQQEELKDLISTNKGIATSIWTVPESMCLPTPTYSSILPTADEVRKTQKQNYPDEVLKDIAEQLKKAAKSTDKYIQIRLPREIFHDVWHQLNNAGYTMQVLLLDGDHYNCRIQW